MNEENEKSNSDKRFKKVYSYKFFKIVCVTNENNNWDRDEFASNLTYKEGLRQFKKLRLDLENNSRHIVSIHLIGVTEEGQEIERFSKEIEYNPENEGFYIENYNQSKEDINNIFESLIEQGSNKEALGFDKESENIDSYSEKIVDYIDKKQVKENTVLSYVKKPKDIVIPREIEIKNIEKDDFKSLDLRKLFKHVCELDTVDIVRHLTDILNILNEKHKHSIDVIDLFSKRRDCVYHSLENISEEEDTEDVLLELTRELVYLGKERRKAKNESVLSNRVFQKLCKISPGDKKPIEDLMYSVPEYNEDTAYNIKAHIFRYKNDFEKDILIKELDKYFDKVSDLSYSVLECYNNISSKKAKTMKRIGVDFVRNEMNLILEIENDNLSCTLNNKKNSEKNNSLEISFGERILKNKGTSIVIKDVSAKAADSLINTIKHKYKKYEYDEGNKKLLLIDRISS